MEYCWDIEKIRKQKKDMKDILRKNPNLTKEQKQDLKNAMKDLTELESTLLPNKIRLSFPKIERYIDRHHLLPRSTYDDYFEIPEDIRNVILGAVNCFRNFNNMSDDIELPQLQLSNQELVDMSDDFYRLLPNKKYLQLYRQYTNPDNHLLHFFPDSNSYAFGETILFYYPIYTPYFSIYRTNTLDDFYTLNHEIAHGIFSRNDDFDTNLAHYYLMELEGFFFEFLSSLYLKEKMDNKVIMQLEYSYFITQFDKFITLYVTHLMIQLTKNKKRISIHDIQDKITQNEIKVCIDKSNLGKSLVIDLTEVVEYPFSYLTSLDLESIYEKDPEYAFYLFERIRNNKTSDILSNLRENQITFMDDGYQNLHKKIKTFEKVMP